ncbi:MAG TPA: hypothetical protein LFW21_06990 [Rickettsia endosymbiont of Pyrocoelia pectoralis]|nr:hypothetical protein [Rickettsia endosymbiont of Pyrocoelia pectoralis]
MYSDDSDDEIDYKTAENILKKIYLPQEWKELQEQDGIDLEGYVDAYNEAELDECHNINFREFFALKDFKETGYMRLYDETRESYEMQRAFLRVTKYQYEMDLGQTEVRTLWRGETREKSEVNIFYPNKEYFTERFMSTTSDQSIIGNFMSDQLKPNQTNVEYEIKVDSVLVGANISAILNDLEEEIVILPYTKFEITDIKFDDDKLCVSMKNKPIIYNEWESNFDTWLCNLEQSIPIGTDVLGLDAL